MGCATIMACQREKEVKINEGTTSRKVREEVRKILEERKKK